MTVNIVSGRGRIMDGEVSDHPLGNKLFLAVVPYHLWVLLRWDFFGQGQHKAPGQLGVPLFLNRFHRVPEGFPVSVFRRSVRWQHDFRVQDAALAGVVFSFLVILRKQLLAALVGGTGNGRLSLAALGDGDLKMRTWNKTSPPKQKDRSFDERSRIIFGCTLCLRMERGVLRPWARAAKG